MIYRVRRIFGYKEDGQPVDSKRSELMNWSVPLNVGGAYYLRSHKLYRIVEPVSDVRE